MSFLNHILKGFTLGYSNRRVLANLMRTTPPDTCIESLSPQQLYAEGIRILALDFDGVLSSHGSVKPFPIAEEWIRQCAAVFGEENLFILSNKPTRERKEWFAAHFPALRFISGVRKKPFPDGLNTIGELAQAPLSNLLMVDDRLLTGCLAAILAGARPCYISRPYVSLSSNLLPEIFFMSIRRAERAFISCCKIF